MDHHPDFIHRPASALACILNYLRFILAVTWTVAWGSARWLRGILSPVRRRLAFVWGSRESPLPMDCAVCHWCGPQRWAEHTYIKGVDGDAVSDADACPNCGCETLEHLPARDLVVVTIGLAIILTWALL